MGTADGGQEQELSGLLRRELDSDGSCACCPLSQRRRFLAASRFLRAGDTAHSHLVTSARVPWRLAQPSCRVTVRSTTEREVRRRGPSWAFESWGWNLIMQT